jgi:hypothetical protein
MSCMGLNNLSTIFYEKKMFELRPLRSARISLNVRSSLELNKTSDQSKQRHLYLFLHNMFTLLFLCNSCAAFGGKIWPFWQVQQRAGVDFIKQFRTRRSITS